MNKNYLFFNRKGQVTISMLLIFMLLFTIFTTFLVTTTEASRSYRFRESMDAAILSGGADLAKGINIYCNMSLIRSGLLIVYSILPIFLVMMPDKIVLIMNINEKIRKLSGHVANLQEYVPIIYTAKGMIDSYTTFFENYPKKNDQSSFFIILPNTLIDNLLNLDFELNLDKIKNPFILKDGFTAFGVREYNFLTKFKNNIYSTKDNFLDNYDIFINSCVVNKRNESFVDLTKAYDIDQFLRLWEFPEEEIEKMLENKLKGISTNLENIIYKIENYSGSFKDSAKKFLDLINKIKDSNVVNIIKKELEKEYNLILKKENLTKEDEQKLERLQDAIFFCNEINKKFIGLISDLNYIILLLNQINFDKQDENLSKNISSLYYTLTNMIMNINNLNYYINKLLENLNYLDIENIENEIIELKKYYYDSKTYESSIKYFWDLLENYKRESSKLMNEVLNNVVFYVLQEILAKAKNVLCGIPPFQIIFDLLNLREALKDIFTLDNSYIETIKKDWSDLQSFFESMENGTFSFISYYSPELSIPTNLFDKIANIPSSTQDLTNFILDNLNKLIIKINNEITKIVEDIINSIIPFDFIKELKNALIVGAITTFIKAFFTLGISLLIDFISSVIITLLTSLIINIIKDRITKPLLNFVNTTIKNKITNILDNMERLKSILNKIQDFQYLILRSIAYIRNLPNYISYYKFYIYDLIKEKAIFI